MPDSPDDGVLSVSTHPLILSFLAFSHSCSLPLTLIRSEALAVVVDLRLRMPAVKRAVLRQPVVKLRAHIIHVNDTAPVALEHVALRHRLALRKGLAL